MTAVIQEDSTTCLHCAPVLATTAVMRKTDTMRPTVGAVERRDLA
jgi:hypothetical protein